MRIEDRGLRTVERGPKIEDRGLDDLISICSLLEEEGLSLDELNAKLGWSFISDLLKADVTTQ